MQIDLKNSNSHTHNDNTLLYPQHYTFQKLGLTTYFVILV